MYRRDARSRSPDHLDRPLRSDSGAPDPPSQRLNQCSHLVETGHEADQSTPRSYTANDRSNRMSDAIDDLAALWRWFGNSQFRDESPIYESIALAVAGDRDVLAVLREAPPAAHLPLAPLAAMRYLLLSGADHPLQDVFTGEADADPGLLFLDACHELRSPLLEVLENASRADQRLRSQRG